MPTIAAEQRKPTGFTPPDHIRCNGKSQFGQDPQILRIVIEERLFKH
ncbi:hypothetical protein RMSM_07266, partial [Rhodopirellula maiorica SM1]